MGWAREIWRSSKLIAGKRKRGRNGEAEMGRAGQAKLKAKGSS